MIRVKLEPGRALLKGHAEYAPRGRDIVCAAVSMLVYVEVRLMEDAGVLQDVRMESGHVELIYDATYRPAALELGLGYLMGEFPKYIRRGA